MPAGRIVTHAEITKAELDALVAKSGATFDGLRYTVPVKLRGGTWKKPVAFTRGGKHYRIDRA